MATHLRMRSATPSVYFDLEKGVLTMIEQNDCQKDCGCKSYSSGDSTSWQGCTYDNVFGLSIMIFTASSKIMSLPNDINRLHLVASSASNFAR